MKKITILTLLGAAWSVALAGLAAEPSPKDQVANADLIAVISVTKVARNIETNGAGRQVISLTAHATIERALKGTPPKTLVIRDADESSVLKADNFSTNVISSGGWHLGTSRLLVFLKSSGDFYVPDGSRVLYPVWGSGLPNQSAVTWPNCTTLDKAEEFIQRALKR